MVSPEGFATQDRIRRAARACASCNARKIRCDITKTGSPCTGCLTEGYECHIPPRKKRRKTIDGDRRNRPDMRAEDDSKSTNQPAAVADSYSPTRSMTGESRSPGSIKSNNDHLRRPSTPPQPGLSQHTMLHHVPHYPFMVNFAHISKDAEVGGQSPELLVSGQVVSPDVISRPESSRAPEDIEFLKQKGALDLPERYIMDGFVSNYFRLIHPFFPIIDKAAFLSSYAKFGAEEKHTSSGPSLLLLQAVLFSASSVTPLELLKGAGYESRKQARQCLYTKTKLLYRFDYETDSVVMVQALLLMSHYYSSMIEQKHTWHWVHQAISIAQATGLHRNPGNIPQGRLWARIWWACLVRDRLVSLGTGRPMHINSLDCDIPMPTLEDLQEPGDDAEELAVKEMFVEFLKLCQYIEGVLSLRYSPAAATRATPEQVKVCDDALKSWLKNLPAVARRQEDPLSVVRHVNIASLYRAILRQLYNLTIIALHQPHEVHGAHEVEFHQQSQQEVKWAALDTTNLVTHLVNADLVKYCPTYCVTCVLPPLIIHLLEIRSSTTPTMTTLYTNQYNLCMIFLQELGKIYGHASFYYDFFELAASIDNKFLEQRQSKTQDPLIAFLKQQMGIKGSPRRKGDNHPPSKGDRQSFMLPGPSTVARAYGAPAVDEEPSTNSSNERESYEIPNNEAYTISTPIIYNTEEVIPASEANATNPGMGDDGSPQFGASISDSMLDVMAREDLQFEEWLKAHWTFQDIFPSA